MSMDRSFATTHPHAPRQGTAVIAHMLAVLALYAMPVGDRVLHAMAQAARCWRCNTHSHAIANTRQCMLSQPQQVDILITQGKQGKTWR